MRHYEDAAQIIDRRATLPPLDDYRDVTALAKDMVQSRQIKPLPRPEHLAFALPDDARGVAIRSAFDAIAPMYWGPRMTLDACIERIQDWLEEMAPK